MSPTTKQGPSEFAAWTSAFRQHMQDALERNAHKGGRENWLKDQPEVLAIRVMDEMDALDQAIAENAGPEVVWRKAASVANMAAMVADSYAERYKP